MVIFLTARDIAQRCDISTQYVHILVRKQELIPAGKTLRGYLVFTEEEVNRYAALRTQMMIKREAQRDNHMG